MEIRCIATGSKGNCYSITVDNETILLDCGIGYKDIVRGIDYQIGSVKAVLLSHMHGDHSCAYKNFIKSGIPIYTNDETVKHFEIVSGELMIGLPELKSHKISDTYTVIPFYLPHTTTFRESMELVSCPNFGWLIIAGKEKILYMTDFEYCKYSFKKQKINHFIVECNYVDEYVDVDEPNYKHVLKGHCSLNTCKKFLEHNKTDEMKNIILVHISDGHGDRDRMVSEICEIIGNGINIQVAEKGFILRESED